MSNITEWIKEELYPTLFHSINIALPELDFKKHSGDWRSGLKLDLSNPKEKRPDKTVVTKRAPGLILEQGGETLSLVDYVMRRDRVEFIQAVKTLAQVVGLQLPRGDIDPDSYQRYKDRATLLEDCNSYFIYCLHNAQGGQEVRLYLGLRGYSDEDVTAMELGYIPSQEKLINYLQKKGYSQSLIEDAVKLHKGIGFTHTLSIPYRSGGSIKGFKFRTIGEATQKYLNSTGLDRSGGFFNLLGIKGDKDIVIVEGELDSLSATARGVENVVATAGNSINSEQVRDAIKRGAKSFTLCFDTEPGKEEDTAKRIASAIEVILGEGVNRVYIVTLPDLGEGKTDPDRLVKESGVEALKNAIRGAIPYWEYKLYNTLETYRKLEEGSGAGLQPRQIDSLLEEIVQTAQQIKDPIDRDRYKSLFISLEPIQELGITSESLTITVDRLTSTKDKQAQEEALSKLLVDTLQLQQKGDTAKALELLESKVKEVKLKDKATEFSSLLIPTSEEQIKQAEANLPDSLDSGFRINGEELLLPGGAISVYSAPTNHGKTILLINTAINVAQRYPDKKFIFLTYEERDTAILQYFLNTYMDVNLNSSDKANRRLLRDYFKTGATQFISSQNLESFEAKKTKFFKDYIETGRILVKYVDYNSEELTTAIEYIAKESKDIGGVFIDYFQLLKLPKEKSSRQEELKQICMSLKDTAVRTGLPLVLAAQFNREVTNLMRLHPTNIGEAGDIERIVNTLIGLWNMDKKPVLKGITDAEVDEINTRISNRRLQGDGAKNMYLEILKSRDLPTGSYDFLEFNGNTGKITNRKTDSSSINYFE
jgi:DNA primase catalytic core